VRTIDLSGRTALILGVASQRSLAWAIAETLGEAGARLAFTYQGERIKDTVMDLAAKFPDSLVLPCDVTSDAEMDGVFWRIGEAFGRLDILIHSIAFARREDLEGDFRKTSRDGWHMALDISAYSLVALVNRSVPLMEKAGGGSIVALTFQASQRVFPHYNVMGAAKAALEHSVRQLAFELGPLNIRVNAISAGPVSTLSARGISGFMQMLQFHREMAPLKRGVEPREVGDAALFLCSEMGSGVTGTTMYVDTGYHIMGTPDPVTAQGRRKKQPGEESKG
jgi:enoyl-[acyl-carrier protein] reductase I